MDYTEEFIKKIVQCGTLGYGLQKIVNIFDIDNETQFIKDFNDKNSTIAKAYQKGIDKSDFLIDNKLFELVKEGDLKALSKFETRKNIQLIKDFFDA